MISKNNSVLIFDPKRFAKNTFTDQNLTFPFKKHEIFAALPMFLIWRGNLLSSMTTCGFFFRTLRRSKDMIFHEKNVQKILLDLFR